MFASQRVHAASSHMTGMPRKKNPLSRSDQMARIRGKNTSPEMRLRRALWREGLRYRLHVRTVAGRPDVLFPRARVCVFLDGCYWHGCPIHYVLPRSRREFWLSKLHDNVTRDRRQTAELEQHGWKVIRVWEHEVAEDLPKIVAEIRSIVAGSENSLSDPWRVEHVEVLNAETDQERRHLVSLRDPARRRVEDRIRSTAKWRISID